MKTTPISENDINENAYFVLVNLLHNMQRDENTDNLGYDIFTCEQISHMANVLGNEMRPGNHSLVSYLSIQFALYKKMGYLNLEKRVKVLYQIAGNWDDTVNRCNC